MSILLDRVLHGPITSGVISVTECRERRPHAHTLCQQLVVCLRAELGANHVMQLVIGLALRRAAAAFRLAGHQFVDDRHELLVDEPLALLL